MRVQDEKKPVYVRLPAPLKMWLQDQATRNHRTLAGELALRLERTKHQDEADEMREAV